MTPFLSFVVGKFPSIFHTSHQSPSHPFQRSDSQIWLLSYAYRVFVSISTYRASSLSFHDVIPSADWWFALNIYWQQKESLCKFDVRTTVSQLPSSQFSIFLPAASATAWYRVPWWVSEWVYVCFLVVCSRLSWHLVALDACPSTCLAHDDDWSKISSCWLSNLWLFDS